MLTTLAAVRLRRRKIPNGTSGAGLRSSQTTKNASSAAAPASRPSVVPEPQPLSRASTIA
jgi:hypothetical protein